LRRYFRSVVLALLTEKYVLIILAFAIASVLWTQDPSVVIKRSFALISSSMFGVYLALRYTVKQQVRLFACALGICLIASVLLALFFPSLGIMGHPHLGAWRGAFTHKNALARLINYSAPIFIIIFLEEKAFLAKFIGLAFSLLSIFLLAMSTAKGALLTLVILLIAMPFFKSLRWRYGYAFPFFVTTLIVVISSGILLAANLEGFFQLLGKDPSLTGRTELWPDIFAKIAERPLLGYGYSAFWLGWNGPSAFVWDFHNWKPPHSHNGFLDLTLDLGLFGLAIFSYGYLANFSRAFFWVRESSSLYDYWPLIVATSIALFNLTESVIINQNSIYWIAYVSTAVSMSVRRPSKSVSSVSSVHSLNSCSTQIENQNTA
jgi:O-antigen ligase